MNMIQKAKEQVQQLTKQAYAAAVKENLLPEGVDRRAVGGDPQGRVQRRLYHHLLSGGGQGA